jgi:hypothetical protein
VTGALTFVLVVTGIGAGATMMWFLLTWTRISPVFGLSLAFIPTAVGLLQDGLLPEFASITVGPVSIHAADIVAIVYLFVVADWYLVRQRRVGTIALATMAFLAVVTSSFLRGIAEHGVFAAANQYRPHLYVVAAIVYFACHPVVHSHQRRIARLWILASFVLSIVSIARWLFPLEPVFGPISTSGPGGAGRPIDAATTFVVLMGAYLAFQYRYRWWVPVAFLGAVVTFQHRTVWLAAIVGLAVLAFGSERRQLWRIAGGSMVVLISMAIASPAVLDSLTEPLDQAAAERGTYEWRVEGWKVSLEDQLRSPSAWVFGRSMGTPWDRRFGEQTVTVSPHSLYVELLLRSGIVGLGSFLMIYALIVRAGLLSEDRRLTTLSLAIVASQLVYAIPYKPDLLQGALIGLLAALLASERGSNAADRVAGDPRTALL